MNRKKILFVIDSLHSGGAEKSLISLLTLFDYSKYKVDLLMFSPYGLYKPLIPKEVNVLEVPDAIRRQQEGITTLLTSWKFDALYTRTRLYIAHKQRLTTRRKHYAQTNWEWMGKHIAKLDTFYDAAIAYSQGMPTYYVAEKVNASTKLCWVNTDYKAANYDKHFDEPFYARFQHIVAVSDVNKEVFTASIPEAIEKTSVVYDIVSPTMIASMANLEGGFQDDFNGMRILTIGRLVESKGYDLVIEACSRLRDNGFTFKWYVIGEGPLKAELEKTVASKGLDDHVKLIGTTQNPYTYLKQCDIYVQPSRFEGFGLAIAEARILKKPIVATNFAAVHNQIKDRWNGLIVSMTGEGLFKGVRELIVCDRLRQTLINNLEEDNAGTEKEIHKVYAFIGSN